MVIALYIFQILEHSQEQSHLRPWGRVYLSLRLILASLTEYTGRWIINNSWLSLHAVAGSNHDDVIKWKHFPRYWPFVWGFRRSPVNSPHKGQWRGALMFSLICVWINGLSKQSWGWWFETPSGSLWRHSNDVTKRWILKQGWSQVCAQPMRDVVTKQRRLSLAGRKPRIIPVKYITENWNHMIILYLII